LCTIFFRSWSKERLLIEISSRLIHRIIFFLAILDFIDNPNESAIDIHRNARQILDKYELDIQGLSAVGSDNTNANMGEHHSVLSLFREEKSNVLKGN
jgi:hypothetical protein